MDFRITDGATDARTHLVEPHGEIDVATAPILEEHLRAVVDDGPQRVVLVDLGGCSFIDSGGLGVLLAARHRLQEGGGDLVVICNDPSVLRVFDITALADVLHVTPSLREALLRAQSLMAG